MRRFPEKDPGTPDHTSPLRYLRRLARTLRRQLTAGVLYAVCCMGAQALIPYAVGRAVDTGVTARDEGRIVFWGAVVFGLGAVQTVTGILRHRYGMVSRFGAAYQTVQVVTRHVTRLGATLHKHLATGEVVAVGVADINSVGNALNVVLRGTAALVTIGVVAALMLVTSAQMALIVLVGVPVVVLVLGLLVRPLHRRAVGLRESQGRLTTRAVDIVTGLRVIRGIGGEETFGARYRAESGEVRRAGVRASRVEALLKAAEVLLPGLLVVVIVWLGARGVLAGEVTAGQLVTSYGYAVFLVTPLTTLIEVIDKAVKGYVAARRVVRVLALEPDLADGPGDREPDGAALVDPDSGLVVREGLLTAVACASRTDTADLADRLGRYTDSAVTLGGVELTRLPLADVRRRILVADNDAHLFSGRLRDELDPAGRGTGLAEAVGTASAGDVVDVLPDRLDTVIAGGWELSGGQQQRLRLVRALMTDPETLVLVEPTSAVDAHTEQRVARRLRAGRSGRSTVVFTTSPILLGQADHVAYVEAGRVVAQGQHRELLADPRYASVVTREDVDR
ncbi:ABC transporter transmembrane domain-containing protein [Streptomyces sp. NPDC088812]|uniref:ABC transporter transmembrane domain-containing protein n=1 Tax=Streptomyces sp. NPDC088812 TaxID=3365905 RepID=UPI003823F62F